MSQQYARYISQTSYTSLENKLPDYRAHHYVILLRAATIEHLMYKVNTGFKCDFTKCAT